MWSIPGPRPAGWDRLKRWTCAACFAVGCWWLFQFVAPGRSLTTVSTDLLVVLLLVSGYGMVFPTGLSVGAGDPGGD